MSSKNVDLTKRFMNNYGGVCINCDLVFFFLRKFYYRKILYYLQNKRYLEIKKRDGNARSYDESR